MKFHKVRARRTWSVTGLRIVDLTDLADAIDVALANSTENEAEFYFRRLSWERLSKQLRRAAKMRGANRVQVWT